MNVRRTVTVLAATAALLLSLTACQSDRQVVGKRHVGTIYYIDCRTGFRDGAKGKEAVIVHQVVTKAKYDKTSAGDDC